MKHLALAAALLTLSGCATGLHGLDSGKAPAANMHHVGLTRLPWGLLASSGSRLNCEQGCEAASAETLQTRLLKQWPDAGRSLELHAEPDLPADLARRLPELETQFAELHPRLLRLLRELLPQLPPVSLQVHLVDPRRRLALEYRSLRPSPLDLRYYFSLKPYDTDPEKAVQDFLTKHGSQWSAAQREARSREARTLLTRLENSVLAAEILASLAHELTHVAQYGDPRLNLAGADEVRERLTREAQAYAVSNYLSLALLTEPGGVLAIGDYRMNHKAPGYRFPLQLPEDLRAGYQGDAFYPANEALSALGSGVWSDQLKAWLGRSDVHNTPQDVESLRLLAKAMLTRPHDYSQGLLPKDTLQTASN